MNYADNDTDTYNEKTLNKNIPMSIAPEFKDAVLTRTPLTNTTFADDQLGFKTALVINNPIDSTRAPLLILQYRGTLLRVFCTHDWGTDRSTIRNLDLRNGYHLYIDANNVKIKGIYSVQLYKRIHVPESADSLPTAQTVLNTIDHILQQILHEDYLFSRGLSASPSLHL